MKLADRNKSRRNFLLAAGAAGVAASAALMSQRAGEGKPTRKTKVSGSAGYHVTEHIRKYYDTTKV